MKNRDDLYLLQDGTHADPADVSRGQDGVLRHRNGVAVCLYADGSPQTIAEDAKRNGNVEAAKVNAEARPGGNVVPPARGPTDRPVAGNQVPREPVKPLSTESVVPGKPVDGKGNVAEPKPAAVVQQTAPAAQHETKAS